jgi:hypothetical protein
MNSSMTLRQGHVARLYATMMKPSANAYMRKLTPQNREAFLVRMLTKIILRSDRNRWKYSKLTLLEQEASRVFEMIFFIDGTLVFTINV